MQKVFKFLKSETVLTAAWALALASMVLVPPDSSYGGYIDWHTLGLLFSLMAVMALFQSLGLFRRLGEALLARTATTRQLEAALVFLPFFTSMAVTNDVALITFVPFALEVLAMAERTERIVPVVVLQTIAANLGSMATPIGNPQNLYLYSHYGLGAADFFAVTAPLTAVSAALLAAFLFFAPANPLALPPVSERPPLDKRRTAAGICLFALCLLAVGGVVSVPVLVIVTALTAAVCGGALRRVDYALLMTFVGFFIFVGNLGRLEAFRGFFQSILAGREVLASVLASQVISNVPAALLLSGFTEDARALLVGTNLGGLGTLIASMASLISYKQVARQYPALRGTYFRRFTALNVLFLLILLGACALF